MLGWGSCWWARCWWLRRVGGGAVMSDGTRSCGDPGPHRRHVWRKSMSRFPDPDPWIPYFEYRCRGVRPAVGQPMRFVLLWCAGMILIIVVVVWLVHG